MKTPINVKGFEKDTIEVEHGQIFSKPILLINGLPAMKDGQGNFLLVRNDGKQVTARWKRDGSRSKAARPDLEVDNKIYQVKSPIKWYEAVLAILPFWVIVVNDGINGAVGIFGFAINLWIVHTDYSRKTKLILLITVSSLAILSWAVPRYIL